MNLRALAEVDSAAHFGALARPETAAWLISLAVHVIAGGIFWQHLGRIEPAAPKPMMMRASIRTLAPPSAPEAARETTPAPQAAREKSVQSVVPAPNRAVARGAAPILVPKQATPTQQLDPVQPTNSTAVAAASAPAAEATASAQSASPIIAVAQPTAPMVAAPPPASSAPPTARASTHQHVAGHVDVKYLHTPKPEYPPAARRRGLEGTVLIRVLVNPDGIPGETRLVGPSGTDALDQAALAAVLRWRFTPAREGNLAIAHWVDIPITFRLDGKS